DEGDALMSKRGEVTRGTDRYANLEVSYLLQAIETHDGIVVVTTNLRANLDNAFLRRFDVNVDFAPPTRQGRAVLWRQELGVSRRGAVRPVRPGARRPRAHRRQHRLRGAAGAGAGAAGRRRAGERVQRVHGGGGGAREAVGDGAGGAVAGAGEGPCSIGWSGRG